MQRLLVVEDEAKLLTSLERGLIEQGYDVATAATGEEGYYIATTQSFDAIVLDVMLPKRGGIQVLQDLRSNGFAAPVLILTARDAIEDKVRGLDAGADDYVVKPFAFAELVARLRALLRRNSIARQLVFKADDLELDVVGRRIVRAGEEIDLSAREFDLLEYLLRHANSTVTRDMIARDIWKESAGVLTNVIDVYIRSLRKKVERPELRQLIHTVRGVGYVLRHS